MTSNVVRTAAQAERKIPLRLACVQFAPQWGQVQRNVEMVRGITARLQPGSLDLLVLPELALAGYVFSGPDEIRPHIEVTHTEAGALSQTSNVSLSLASKLAARLGCYVVLGFPERGLAPSAHSQTQASRPEVSVQSSHSRTIQRPADSRVRGEPTWPTPPSTEHGWYNSAMLVDRQGQLLKVFRKHFLFEDDKRWATEGPGFEFIDLPDLGRLCVAICMDLNPFEFKAPFETYELATFCAQNSVDILAVPMAWLLPSKSAPGAEESSTTSEAKNEIDRPSMSTINYWAMRCTPLFEGEVEVEVSDKSPAKETIFVAANRIGSEKSSTFAGSSCILRFEQGEQPEMQGCLGTRTTGILQVEC